VSSPLIPHLHRRRLLQGSAVLGGLNLVGLGGCATAGGVAAGPSSPTIRPFYDIAPVRAERDRVFDITVCLRPFRAAGPRLETEQVGDTLVVHNYGHGGSGWSLSWGSGEIAVGKAMALSPRHVAVIGCGAIGLTSAILAQRAGAEVTIYAKELLPKTRSSRATGSFTPDSRIALANVAGPAFGDLWEQMARTSFKTYRSYLGLPGRPVEWNDRYVVSDAPRQTHRSAPAAGALDFADYGDRIRDLLPDYEALPAGSTPFQAPYVRRSSSMMFNIADYAHTLMNDFMICGGKIERREFHSPSELSDLPEKVVINCPGYGGRALWKDETIVPVRGQIQWLIPQPEVDYGVYYKDVSVLSRTDGIVVQALDGGDMKGYGVADETPDPGEADRAVAVVAALYSQFGSRSAGFRLV
jgi:glycine/D-amino acid oxidase-like deaminating enzyme